MNIQNRITKLESDLQELRNQYKDASPMFKKHLIEKAKTVNAELSMLQRVLKRREIKKNNPATTLFD